MTVVSNTGPLIALAKADLLEVLEAIYGKVAIPLAVHQELLMRPDLLEEIERLDTAISRGILSVVDRRSSPVVIRPPVPEVERRTRELDRGEREAIGLVFQLRDPLEFVPPPLLLIDDKAGRRAASELGVSVKGVVGILLQAKEDGHITDVGPLLKLMRTNGYWLSDATVRKALKLAGETSS